MADDHAADSSQERTLASARAAAVRRYAGRYRPREIAGYVVHNEFFAPRTRYEAADIAAVFDDLTGRGTFAIASDPVTGLVQTSDTVNAAMRRQWFTDSVMVSRMQRVQAPASCLQATIVTAAALATPDVLDAVARTEADPAWYRDGGLRNGVSHIYLPQSVRCGTDGMPDITAIRGDEAWFNQKRLESQALVLVHVVDTLLEGVAERPAAWGLPVERIATPQGRLLLATAIRMARYLIAANTAPAGGTPDFRTPSASSWEELPLPDGMTSDAAFAVLGWERLRDLLHAPTSNPRLLRLRRGACEPGFDLPDPPTAGRLEAWIEAGRRFVAERVVTPLETGRLPMQNPLRPLDTSLTLLAASPYRFFADDPVRDARIRHGLVAACCEGLLGPHGMRRYGAFEFDGRTLHDSYLNIGYHMPAAERAQALGRGGAGRTFGSSDASTVELLAERQTLSEAEWAAQWSIGPTASLQALAAAKRTLASADHGDTPLATAIEEGIRDMINRCVAAIPGRLSAEPPLRSDGTLLPPYQVMEAYEAVIAEDGRRLFMPGAHTLPWSTAQLFDGLRLALAACGHR